MGILQISWAHTGNDVNSTDSRRKRWNPWISSDFGKSDWPSWKSDKMPEMWRITRNPIAQPPDGPPRLQNAAESASEAGEAAHQGSPQQRRATPTGATAEHKQNVVFPWYFGSIGLMAIKPIEPEYQGITTFCLCSAVASIGVARRCSGAS